MHHMEEELGDVLLQVVMHTHRWRKEAGHFDFEAVCAGGEREVGSPAPACVRRQCETSSDSDAVLKQWDAKLRRKRRSAALKQARTI